MNFRSIIELYENLRQRSKFREEFRTEMVLGQGQFGSVWSVRHRSENTMSERSTEFALKRMVIKSVDALDDIRMIVNESEILKKLNTHPNIVRYFNSWLEVDDVDEDASDTLIFYLQMELCGMSLSKWKELNPKRQLSQKTLYRMTAQLFDALEWIHQNNTLHLDINVRSKS